MSFLRFFLRFILRFSLGFFLRFFSSGNADLMIVLVGGNCVPRLLYILGLRIDSRGVF